jgi:hypothetical protein
MAALLKKGPGKAYITYLEDADEVRIPVTPTTTPEGEPAFDAFTVDARDLKGEAPCLMLLLKIKRAMVDLPNPLDAKLIVH